MNSMKRQKDRTLKDELPRSVGAQYATREEWRNNSRKNEETEPKWKQYPAVDVTGDRSKGQCCKEHYCIGTWNVRSMNQGKLEVVKQEMARVDIDILGIRELKWLEWMNFIQMTIISTTVARIPWKKWSNPHRLTKEWEMQYFGEISKMTERSLFASKATHSKSQ